MGIRDVEGEPVRKGGLGLGVLVCLGAVAFSGRGVVAAQQGELRSSHEAAAKPDGPSSAQFALSLINSGVEAARSCEPVSQAIVLMMAGDAVRTLDREKALTYYAGSFEADENIGRSDLRLVLQPMLVAQIADLDLGEAAGLVERMDTPEMTTDPDVDRRVATAGRVIEKLLARNAPDDPDKAVHLLDYLGDTGQYPYAAAGETITFFHQRGEDWRGVDVFMRAMGYFREDNRFKDTPRQFVDLMQTSEGKVPDSVLVSGLHLCMATLKDRITSQGTTGTPSRRWPLGVSEDLVARLQMIARRLDPRSVNELRGLYTKLPEPIMEQARPAGERSDLPRATESRTEPDGRVEEKGEVTEAQQAWREARALADKDPAAALARAAAIQLPEYRSRALAAVAKSIRTPEKAASALHAAEAAAEQIDSSQGASLEEWIEKTSGKVRAMAEIAEGWERWGDAEKASATTGKAFALALDLIQKEGTLRPEAPSGFGTSASSLSRLAQAAASLDPTQAAQRAQAISDPRLRAYFLVSVAREILRKT